MTPAWWGALLGLTFAAGVLLVAARVGAIRRPQLALRVLPYLRDLPAFARTPGVAPGAADGLLGVLLRPAADAVERVLGGAESVRRRLERAGLDLSVHDFRVRQVVWGLIGFAVTAAYAVLQSLTGGDLFISVLLCVLGFTLGVILRDYHLSSQARDRERRILLEFPAVAELLARRSPRAKVR